MRMWIKSTELPIAVQVEALNFYTLNIMCSELSQVAAGANSCNAMGAGTIFKTRAGLKSQTSRGNIVKRTVSLYATFCISMASMFAQDIITLKNGEDIQAVVQEIGTDDVKYKKFENQDGPSYMLKKSGIFMIRYANGSKDVFAENPAPTENIKQSVPKEKPSKVKAQDNPDALKIKFNFWSYIDVTNSNGDRLSKNQIRDVMRSTPDALAVYNKGCSLSTTGKVLMFSGCGVMLVGATGAIIDMGNSSYDSDTYTYWLYGAGAGAVAAIVGVILYPVGKGKVASSVRLYNKTISQPHRQSEVSLNFGVTRSGGIGFTANF